MSENRKVYNLEKILTDLKEKITITEESDDIIRNFKKQIENLYISVTLQLCREKIDDNLTKETENEIEKVKEYFMIFEKYKDTILNDEEFVNYLYKDI